MKRSLAGVLPAVLLVAGGLLAGCGPDDRESPASEAAAAPFADCATLTTAPSQAETAASQAEAAPSQAEAAPSQAEAAARRAETAASPTETAVSPGAPEQAASASGDDPVSPRRLPELRLPCFTGDAQVALDAVRGPAVINLWASWCEPCRSELPALQRLAQRHAGRLHVVGVDTRDRRAAALDVASELGVTFPQLYDPNQQLLRAVARPGLPVTVLVDGQGTIRHIHDTGQLDDRSLAVLVARHLGVSA